MPLKNAMAFVLVACLLACGSDSSPAPTDPYAIMFNGTWISNASSDTSFWHPTQSGSHITGIVVSMDGADTAHYTGTATATTVALTLTFPSAGSPLVLDFAGTYVDTRHLNGTLSVHGQPGTDNPLNLTRVVN
jgi:hypothetical protein